MDGKCKTCDGLGYIPVFVNGHEGRSECPQCQDWDTSNEFLKYIEEHQKEKKKEP